VEAEAALGVHDILLRRLLSCHDPRLEQAEIAEALGTTRNTVKKLLQRLRQGVAARRIVAVHLRLIEALGVSGVVVELEPPDARELLRRLRPFRGPARPGAVEGVVPLPRLLATVFRLADGRLLAVYRAPRGFEDEVLEVLGSDRRLRGIHEQRLYSVPVRGCLEPREAAEVYARLHGLGLEDPRPVLDMLVIGVLDANPLARLRREDMDPSPVVEARLGEAVDASRLYPLVRSRYRFLSLRGVLGRVYYVQPSDLLRSKSLVVAEASAAPMIYAAAVETMGAAYVASGEELSLATASADAENFHRLVRAAGAEVQDVVFMAAFLPPFEHYDCRSGVFRLEPMSLQELEECLRPGGGEARGEGAVGQE